jgi:hypothetical protein
MLTRSKLVLLGGFPVCFLHGRFPLMNAWPFLGCT